MTYIPNSPNIMNVTYAELTSLISINKLLKGTRYRITDYATKHEVYDNGVIVPGETLTASTEPLIVLAVDNNKLSAQAYSEAYPEDIIYYEVTSDQSVVPGCDKGYIYRRHDTKKNINLGFDWRAVKFRRWRLNVTATWSNVTTYNRGDAVISGSSIYISITDGNLNNVVGSTSHWTSAPFQNATDSSWQKTTLKLAGTIASQTKTELPIDNNYYSDYLMFSGSAPGNIVNKANSSSGVDIIKSNNNVVTQSDNFFNVYITSNNFTDNHLGFVRNTRFEGWFYNNFIAGIDNIKSNSGTSINANCLVTFRYSTFNSSSRCFSNIGNTFESNEVASSISIIQCAFYKMSSNTFLSNDHATQFRRIISGDVNLQANNFFGGFDSIDFSSATHVHNNYKCDIYSRPEGTVKLKYVDNNDNINITDITA